MRLVALLLLVDMEEEEELVELVVTLEVLVLWLVHAATADDDTGGDTVSLEEGSLGEATAATAAALLVISFSRLLSFSQLSRLFRLFMLLKIICSDSNRTCPCFGVE
uniref:Putative secreted protein n=1 Tax=Anopheles marajoara TaxID=58244 RepID=A0A2M4C868_9DIPT